MTNLQRYNGLGDDALRYIIKDASEAARAMQGMNPEAESKYLDQANDAATILYRRRAKRSPEA